MNKCLSNMTERGGGQHPARSLSAPRLISSYSLLAGIWTKEGADVNLTDHLINMVRPWKQVQDLDIKIGRREKLAYCSGTRGNCTLTAKNHSRSGFRDRLKLKDGSILLTGIHPGDDGLKMEIDVHWRGGGRRRRRSVGGKRVRRFTLKIRLRAPRGELLRNFVRSSSCIQFSNILIIIHL